jgi:predicted acyl esterase
MSESKKNLKETGSQQSYNLVIDKDVYVEMPDGVRLCVDVYRPDAPGKFPALLAMGPYGKELQTLNATFPPQPLHRSSVWDGNIEAGDYREIVSRGYVHVVADVRGTGKSEGEYIGWSPQEGKDGYQLVEWIAQQPWCDGNVGMLGYSYYAKTQLKTAINQPPHLKAIYVSHVIVDIYRELAYNGGVLSLFLYGLWDGRHGTSGFAPKNAVSEMVKTLPKEELERRHQELLKNPDISNYPNLYHLLHYPYKNPMFFDILLNPYDGPFYAEKSIYPYFDKIKVPVYIVGKCAHVAQGYWYLWKGIKGIKKLLVKPSGPEERPWREDMEEVFRWFDYWLKGINTGVLDEPPIKIYVMGINQYRYLNEWPLPGIKWTKCYLRRWEGLLFAPELYHPEPDCFLQQPLHLSIKRDYVQYLSPPVPEDIEVIGPCALNFYAAIDQDDTNWIVTLYDVAPHGAETKLGKGYLKATHRAVDQSKSAPGEPYHPHTGPDPIVPGQIYEYNIGLSVVTHVFRPGHRIKIRIESMESPRDPEMQIHYHPHLCSSKTTVHKIYRNREYQSHLLLPIIPKEGYERIIKILSDENLLGGSPEFGA